MSELISKQQSRYLFNKQVWLIIDSVGDKKLCDELITDLRVRFPHEWVDKFLLVLEEYKKITKQDEWYIWRRWLINKYPLKE